MCLCAQARESVCIEQTDKRSQKKSLIHPAPNKTRQQSFRKHFYVFTPQIYLKMSACFMSLPSLSRVINTPVVVLLCVLTCMRPWRLLACVDIFSTVLFCIGLRCSVCVFVCAAGQISLPCKPLICSAVNNRAGITNKVSIQALKRATKVEFLKEAHADKADKY